MNTQKCIVDYEQLPHQLRKPFPPLRSTQHNVPQFAQQMIMINDQFDQQITVSQSQALRILSGGISLKLS